MLIPIPEMSDEEFLSYLESHLATPDCGVVPQHIARLLRLAGHEEMAKRWDSKAGQVIRGAHNEIRTYVKEARTRMAEDKPTAITTAVKQIWKFPLPLEAHQVVYMPLGSKILSVGEAMSKAFMWAEVFPANGVEGRCISMYGTGLQIPDIPGEFIGTLLMHNGSIEFHVYEDED
jgi:hypothetical protein